MKDYRALVESDKSVGEIFSIIKEKTSAGNIPRVGDHLRLLEDNGDRKKGDIIEVKTFQDTSESKDLSSFSIGTDGGNLDFSRADIDKKFQMVYDA